MKKLKIIDDGNAVSPKGFVASGISAGLKNKKKDLSLILSEKEATAAMVVTANTLKAAPIKWNSQHFHVGDKKKGILINSGNANACTGQEGLDKIDLIAEEINNTYNIPRDKMLFASTGVIGVPLPQEKIINALEKLFNNKGNKSSNGEDAARAILTTDLVTKTIAVQVTLKDKVVTIGAMAKGSGMICPNMATMLCFITTDLNIQGDCLQKILNDAVADSFNMISVDGDMSTNDTVIVLANGMAENEMVTLDNLDEDENQVLIEAFDIIHKALAKSIAKDGEGATKLMEVQIMGADTKENARIIAKQIVDSSLVKTAVFGADANWGRVVMAVGSTGIAIDENVLQMHFASKVGKVDVLAEGRPLEFDEDLATKILSEDEMRIIFNLNMGNCEATAWGCDLSYDYVKINGSYRS
ncbi:MAG: bifunctional glutamate N-acetyltransferase/amino-acid acetyltransferase ArgJ [Eubacteriaceae bacterium]|jgi:glutamate N-acetyltransferase/amino-acid N-acetyltransferase|nr:bifunctional glutamate N-acetyltransferase/amino-acid acetyltransferase ArgJ [Eubacteriaceae bacterium]